jgi:hypothetical protein
LNNSLYGILFSSKESSSVYPFANVSVSPEKHISNLYSGLSARKSSLVNTLMFGNLYGKSARAFVLKSILESGLGTFVVLGSFQSIHSIII